jgi:hypothetical protein
MNVDEADGFDPEHLEKWWKVSRAYLTGPFAELPPDDVAQAIVPHAVPPVCDNRSVLLSRLINRAKQQGLVKSGVDAQAAACVLVGLIQGMALRMNAGPGRPEMLLREAVSEFSGYLDGIRASA